MSEILTKSWAAAAKGLREDYRKIQQDGREQTMIVCGPGGFQHIHGRDFPFASGGALLLKDFDAVRDTLGLFYAHQRKDGLFPRSLSPWPPYLMIPLGYVGVPMDFKAPMMATFRSESLVYNYDVNAHMVWTLLRLERAAKDLEFARRHWPAAVKGMDWYEGQKKDGLVSQQPFSDWQDSVGRKGRVFYTNLLYWKGLESMSLLAQDLGDEAASKSWRAKADKTAADIRDFFWDEKIGAFKNGENLPGIETSPNVFAIARGFTNRAESERILQAFDSQKVWRRLGARATVPDYPLKMKSIYCRIGENADYHDSQVWSWTVAETAQAYHKIGETKRAIESMEPMAKIVLQDGEVGECYEDDGQVRRRIFSSGTPFAWGSGMWLEALAALGLGGAQAS